MSKFKKRRLTSDGEGNVSAVGDESVEIAEKKHTEQTRSLFVRSLPVSATTDSLTALFSNLFPLKHATVVLDPRTKESKGYGFVTFVDPEDVQSAKEAFDGSIVDGKRIKIELAKPRMRQPHDTDVRGHLGAVTTSPPTGDAQKSSRLIVRNLPWKIKDADQLSLLFRSFGKVKQASMPKRGPGLSAGFGFVLLRGHKNAERAMEVLNGKNIDGRTIAIDWAVKKDTWNDLQQEICDDEEQEDRRQEGRSTGDFQKKVVSGDESEVAIPDEEKSTQSNNLGKCDVKWNEEADFQVDLHGHEDDEEEEEEDDDGDDDNDIDIDEEVEKGSDSEGDHERIRLEDSREEDTRQEDSEAEDESEDDKSSTLFIRNLPFTATDESLSEHFSRFGSVRYARIVLDQTTTRSKGVGFINFYNKQDADACIKSAPRMTSALNRQSNVPSIMAGRHSLLQDTNIDHSADYTLLGRVLQIARAVDRSESTRLTLASKSLREDRDHDKRRLYLLGEGSIPATSSLYPKLSQTEIKMREDSLRQRQSLIKTNPSLHLSLTRLSVRNLPRDVSSKALKALAREAAVGFAKDVKAGLRKHLTKDELSRGGSEMVDAEKLRKSKGKGIVKQAKVVFEGREGSKVAEGSGAGRSRGYGFIEYSSHRWALMGLRWLNGHAINSATGSSRLPNRETRKRLIVEFAIENAQVVLRRREEELKAQESAKLLKERRETEELPAKVEQQPKVLSKVHENGIKRKLDDSQRKIANPRESKVTETLADGLAKRQKIIGRKRMQRKSRGKL